MKFNGSKTISQPREKVVELFLDTEAMKHYQDGFIKKEVLEGNPREKGTISKVYYQHGKRDMVLTETITSNDLPNFFEAFYHHKHMDNTMKSTFTAITPNITRYDYEIDYIRLSWVLPRLMAILFPSVYRNQVEKWMKQFKAYAENQN